MTRKSRRAIAALVLGGLMGAARAETPSGAPVPPRVAEPCVFTDGLARIAVPGLSGTVAYRVQTVTVDGWGPAGEGRAPVRDGGIDIPPLAEGIHIVTLPARAGDAEVRFLAVTPPEAPDPETLRRTLPRTAEKLLSGQAFRLLSMGDSVTATGDYESLLVMLLKRATGNDRISFLERAYPGRSVDATVREFPRDAAANDPDLGLLMYGLNDQAAGYVLADYVAQYGWVAGHLASACNADTVFMQPTPVFYLSVFGVTQSRPGLPPDPPWFIMRTVRFAHALRGLGAELGVPVAETFDALWGRGGPTLEDSARAMWPCFPPHHRMQLHSLLESDGRGDCIHPNALGHLQLARAAFRAIAGTPPPEPPLALRGVTRWTDRGAVSTVTAVHRGASPRRGLLKAYPLRDAAVLMDRPGCYALDPGASLRFEVRRPDVHAAEALLSHPYNRYLARGTPVIPVVDFADCGSRVYAVEAPFEVPLAIVRERMTVTGRQVPVTVRCGDETWTRTVTIPAGAAVGGTSVVERVTRDGAAGAAAAEVLYARYGAARRGEAELDGRLDEWGAHVWEPVGFPVQARARLKPEDARESPDEFFLHWAFKAGTNGLYLAARIRGDPSGDRCFIFFDPRPPEALGTVGGYYWVLGARRTPMLVEDGTVRLFKGETSPAAAPVPRGAWQRKGNSATLEIHVPYAVMEREAWPPSGDLGVSIVWEHDHGDGRRTRLCWTETAHEWTPVRYGVVRRAGGATSPDTAWPYLVRVE
ncbi:MAG: hypothetical protein JW951_05985 [Lentisphaerae bacterium]|nr:hypothetical protein [Lentisphaerota bacterium]